MAEGATAVTCLDEAIKLHHKSSLAPDEPIELSVLRNPPLVDAHSQQQASQVNRSSIVFMTCLPRLETAQNHICLARMKFNLSSR